jgi:hypothetical protein
MSGGFGKTLLTIATGGLVGLAGSLLTRKKTEPRAPQRRVTRNEARIRADENDRIGRRKGTNANRRVDFGAGEAVTGPKTSLLGRTVG